MIEWPAQRVKVADLKPFEKNPRTITPAAYGRLRDKIERLGFNSPIVATHDLRIIGGQNFTDKHAIHAETGQAFDARRK